MLPHLVKARKGLTVGEILEASQRRSQGDRCHNLKKAQGPASSTENEHDMIYFSHIDAEAS
jgi:hypothetical protein